MSVSTFCFSSLVQIDSRCVRQLLVSGSLCTAGRLLSIHWGTSRPKRNVRELQKSLKTRMFFWLFLMLQVSFHFRCHNVELEEALARFCFPSSRRPTEHWSKIFNYWHKRKILSSCVFTLFDRTVRPDRDRHKEFVLKSFQAQLLQVLHCLDFQSLNVLKGLTTNSCSLLL